MKKNEVVELKIEGISFPGKSWGMHGEKKVIMKNGLPGQRVADCNGFHGGSPG